jgi:hypothetical protein
MVDAGRGWKCVEETRNIQKYLATTMGRGLDMGLSVKKKKLAVR